MATLKNAIPGRVKQKHPAPEKSRGLKIPAWLQEQGDNYIEGLSSQEDLKAVFKDIKYILSELLRGD